MIKILLSAGLLLGFAFYMMPSDQKVQAVEAQKNHEKETVDFLKRARVAKSIMYDDGVVELSERVKADLERGEFNPAWYIMDRLKNKNPDILSASLAESGEMTFTNTANDVMVSCKHEDHSHRWQTVCMATSLSGEEFFDKSVF